MRGEYGVSRNATTPRLWPPETTPTSYLFAAFGIGYMNWTTGSNGKVRLAVSDGVAEIRLSHPEKLNCFSLELAEDLRDLTLSIDDYDDVSAVVVTAEGRSFSAGADVDIVGGNDSEANERLQELYGPAFEWMRNEPIPVIAGGRGPAVGAGASVLCYAADLRVVGDDIEIWWPEVAYGIPPLSRLIALREDIGAPHALEFMLLGEDAKMGAEEAHELGLINRVVDPGEVDEVARNMAETIAKYDAEHGIVGGFLDTLRHARTEEHSGSTAYATYRRDVEQGFRGSGS
jgi:2-(1,2-epoxy-1,2-dihydrophenyl)acetyl-CoA isomerase